MPWYGYALIAAVSIAAVGLLQKRNLQQEHSTEYVTVFSSIKLLLFLLLFGRVVDWHVTSNQFILLVIDGILASIAFYLTAKAMRRLELSTVLPVLSLEPGLVAVLAAMFLGEIIRGGHLLGLGLLVVGAYVLEFERQHAHPATISPAQTLINPLRRLIARPGGGYAFGALFFFSASSVLDRYLLQHVPTTTYLAYIFTTMTIFFLLRFFLIREQLVVFRRGYRPLLFTIVAIAGLHLLSNYSQAQATGLAAVGLVIALKRLSVLLDVIIGGRFFHEHHLAQKTVASLIVLIGAYFIVAT
ncbi:MAG: EamA family transporter [Candidatus Kerfeldbacteria bacterium]|nr:EamA family transporter [Candidatus Kerfeldbacteria bacterium]